MAAIYHDSFFYFILFTSKILQGKIGNYFSVEITTTLQSPFSGSCGQYIYLRSSYCSHEQTQISEKVYPFWKLIIAFCEWFEVSLSRLGWGYSNLHVVTMGKRTHFKCYFCKKSYTLNMIISFERTLHFDKWKYFFSEENLLLSYYLKVIEYSVLIPLHKVILVSWLIYKPVNTTD